MPYLVCQSCGFRAYSAAGHASVDDCPVCGSPLPVRRAPGGLRQLPSVPRSPTSGAAAIRAEIEERLGRVPAFFEPAFANADVLRELWRRTQLEWLDSPVPSGFRHALADALAAQSPWPWDALAELAGPDRQRPEAVPYLLDASVALPTGERQLEDWPAEKTPDHDELVALAAQLAMDRPEPEVRARLLARLGERRYADLVALLTYLETCRTFAHAYPDRSAAAGSRHRRAADHKRLPVIEGDRHGVITSFSPAAEAAFDYAADDVVGRQLSDLFTSESGSSLQQLIHDFAHEDDAAFRKPTFGVLGHRRDGTAFSAGLTLANRGRNGTVGGVTAVVDTERVAGRPEHAAAYQVLLNLVEEGATSLPPAALLATIAQTLGWNYMLLWQCDNDADAVRCLSVQALAGEVSEEVALRAEKTFTLGEGMMGAVCQSGAPAWVEDLSPTGTRSLASGVWLPLGTGGTVDGVLELLSASQRRPDPVLLEIFSTLTPDLEALRDHSVRPGDERGGTTSSDALSRARLAFEGAPVGMALVSVGPDGATVVTEVNRALSAITGRDASELRGRSLDEITFSEDVDRDADLRARLLGGHIPSYATAKRFQRADGQVFWGELSVSLIRADDESRRPLYLVVQLADITERRRVEDALDDSRDRLVSAFHEAPIGMALATLGGDWLQVNEAMCLTVGYSDEELLSKRLPDLIAPEEAEAMQRYLRQLTAGDVLGYHVETRVVRGDGEVIWVLLSVSLLHDYEGAPEYLLTEVQDISERKRVEEELEQGALLDALTSLPSRALLFDRLEQARRRLERTGTPFAVLFAAAKGFDELASQIGRERSDSALRELSSRLRGAVRSGDTVARYGPDEFVIVCEQLASDAKVATIAHRILELGTFPVGEGESAQRVSVKVGITVAADSGDSPAGLVERADAAMQAAEGESAGYEEYCDTL